MAQRVPYRAGRSPRALCLPGNRRVSRRSILRGPGARALATSRARAPRNDCSPGEGDPRLPRVCGPDGGRGRLRRSAARLNAFPSQSEWREVVRHHRTEFSLRPLRGLKELARLPRLRLKLGVVGILRRSRQDGEARIDIVNLLEPILRELRPSKSEPGDRHATLPAAAFSQRDVSVEADV